MAEVTVRAAMELDILRDGTEATVERTDYIDGLIRSGALDVVPVPSPPAPGAEPAASRSEAAQTSSRRGRSRKASG